MAYTTPRTWTAGEKPTAAQFNEQFRDNLAFLANPPACRVYHNAGQSVGDAATVFLTFGFERYDTDNMHSTSVNPTRITFNTAGLYLVTFHGQFAAANDYQATQAFLRKNGSTYIASGPGSAAAVGFAACQVAVSTVYKFAVGDYVEASPFQKNSAGAARSLESGGQYTPEFAATWIGLG